MESGARIDCTEKDRKRYLIRVDGNQTQASRALAVVEAAQSGRMHATISLTDASHLKLLSQSGAGNLQKVRDDTGAQIELREAECAVAVVGSVEAVRRAEQDLQRLLAFFFPDEYVRIRLPSTFVEALFESRAARLRAIQADSVGCSVRVDQRRGTLTLRGERDAVARARAAVESQLREHAHENVEIGIPDSAMIAKLIGPKGAHINAMREKSGARFDIDRENLVVLVRGKREQVAAGHALVLELFEAHARRHISIDIDPEFAPTLIGKGGVTVRALQDDTGCKIDVDRVNGRVTVRGDENKLPGARELIHAMVQEYEERRHREIMESTRQEEEERVREREERERRRITREAEGAAAGPFDEHRSGPETTEVAQASKHDYLDVPVGMDRQSKSTRRRQRQRQEMEPKADSLALKMLMRLNVPEQAADEQVSQLYRRQDSEMRKSEHDVGNWDNPVPPPMQTATQDGTGPATAVSLLGGLEMPAGLVNKGGARKGDGGYYRSNSGYRVRL
jgi:rRNA processing protein Krr1/Pno1